MSLFLFFLQVVSAPTNTVWNFKRLVGRLFSDPVVQNEAKYLPYKLVELPSGYVGVEVYIKFFLYNFELANVLNNCSKYVTGLPNTQGIFILTKIFGKLREF